MKTRTSCSSRRKLILSISTVLLLSFCLCIATYALTRVSVEGNVFSSTDSRVDIEVSNFTPIYANPSGDNVSANQELQETQATPMIVEPGMRISKSFTVTNNSSCDIYYKLYLTDMEESLAAAFDAEIAEAGANAPIYSGRATDLTRDGKNGMEAERWEAPTDENSKQKQYVITLTFTENSGNEWKGAIPMDFKLEAAATQAKNNTNKEF